MPRDFAFDIDGLRGVDGEIHSNHLGLFAQSLRLRQREVFLGLPSNVNTPIALKIDDISD